MSAQLPGDLQDWLERLQLQQRVAELRKNPVSAFCDGVLLAEIVKAMYPKFPGNFAACSLEETLNTDTRLKNWELLQSKVLSVINCDLQRHDIMCIARREIDKAAVVSFLRILRTKLVSFHPQYLEHTRVLAAKQRQLKSQQQQSAPPTPTSVAAPPSSASRSPPAAKKVSQEVRAKLKAREAVKQMAASLSEEDIDAMYRDVSGRYRASASSLAQRLDEQQKRSQNIDANISLLREQNLADMVKAETRLAHLHMQLNALSTHAAPISAAAAAAAIEAEAEREESERFGAGRGGQSSKTAHLTRLIMSELGLRYGTNDRSRFPTDRRRAMEQRISRKSSIILSRLGLATPGSSFAVGASDGAGKASNTSELDRLADLSLADEALLAMDDDAMHRHVVASLTGAASQLPSPGGSVFSFGRSAEGKVRPRSPSPSKAAARGSSASVGSISTASKALAPTPSSSSSSPTRAPVPATASAPTPAPTPAPSSSSNSAKPLATMTHRRVYDDHHQRHFYVDEATGKSAWHLPKEGIVACTDESDQVFFINAVSKKSAWKLEDCV